MRFSNWQNKFSALWLLVLCVIALALGVAWLNKGIKIETNIFALLPEAHQDAHLEQAQQYVSQQLNDKVFVVLDAKTDQQLEAACRVGSAPDFTTLPRTATLTAFRAMIRTLPYSIDNA